MESFLDFYCKIQRNLETTIHNAAQPWYDTFDAMPQIDPVRNMKKFFEEEEERRLRILRQMMPGNCSCLVK